MCEVVDGTLRTLGAYYVVFLHVYILTEVLN